MARRKRVIKKLRRAEVAAHRVARQPATAASQADHRCEYADGNGACSATSWSANAVGVLIEVLGADTCEQPSRLPERGVRGLATASKHYLCWQKRFGGRWWSGRKKTVAGSNPVRP